MPIIKEKKPSGLVFSLCKLSVEMDGLKELYSSHEGQPGHLGPWMGICLQPQAWSTPSKLGFVGKEAGCPPAAPESLQTCVSSTVSPSGAAKMLFFIVPFSLFQGCL